MALKSEKAVSAKARGLPSALVAVLQEKAPLAIAFSGGLDSRFLCHVSLLADLDPLAIMAFGPHTPASETEAARNWARGRGLSLIEVEYDPLRTAAARNDRNRCYACKTALFSEIKRALRNVGEDGRVLCDGANMDDLGEYRPGLRAAREAGVVSPLVLSGLGKADVRRAAAFSCMDNPGQRPRPCLLTRFAYGVAPDRETLAAVAKAEANIAAILAGLENPPDFRLRLTPEPALQLEAAPGDFGEKALAALEKAGFPGARLEIGGKISGYFDRVSGVLYKGAG